MDTALRPDLAQHDEFLDRLLAVPVIGAARLSPDGKWVAWLLSGLGETLAAGQIVTTGACMKPLEIAPGDAVVADYGALGKVDLRFAAA